MGELFAQPRIRPCRSGELYGYCDESGKVIIPQIFQKTGPFQGNIAPVVRDDMYWWFLDREGIFRFNTRRWSDQMPPEPDKGLYIIRYFDPIFAHVTEYYNKNGLPVKVWSEDSTNADTIVYKIFNVQDAIAIAKSKMGTPYGQNSMDCSGYIRFIFQPFGITLPYFAREIATTGREIKPEQIKPGDLVFYGGSMVGDMTVNHVGLVTSLVGKKFDFIHASTSKGVIINKNTDPYYKPRFLFARRLFN